MAFLPIAGKVQYESLPKTASTAIAMGAVLEASGSGTVNPADAADIRLFGICMQTIAAADSDYASTTPIVVCVLNPETEFLADVGTGSASAALVGTRCDLTNSVSLDVTASARGVFTITKFISATQVIGRFNSSYQFVNAA